MTLGLLVNTDKNLKHISGLAKAAAGKGHEVIIFAMDDGVKLLGEREFTALSNIGCITMSFCDYSTKALNIPKDKIPDKIICGSQYNNASMTHRADKVIVL